MMRGGCVVRLPENHSSVMNRIMHRFRPIAPKPSGGEDFSAAAEMERRGVSGKNCRRTKRKYVRNRGRQSCKRKTKEKGRSSPPERSEIEDASSPDKGAVTLQLLPERSESERSCGNSSAALCFQETDRRRVDGEVHYHKADADGLGTASAALANVRSVIKSWIVVEQVTETYIDPGVGLGFSDRERIKNLQADTCPGFVSDGSNYVVWVNEAYRKMVAEGEAGENGLTVWLVEKEKLPYLAPSFACRVRLIQQTQHGHKGNKIVPCDVWRMGFTGFAWKLDVKTALSLGI